MNTITTSQDHGYKPGDHVEITTLDRRRCHRSHGSGNDPGLVQQVQAFHVPLVGAEFHEIRIEEVSFSIFFCSSVDSIVAIGTADQAANIRWLDPLA